MKLKELLSHILVLAMSADPETEISGVSYDSRRTQPGDLFVAVRGFESDGHRFIPKAVERGAAAVLCETPPEDGTPYVQTDDCRLGLALCSRNFFGNPAGEMTVIGITGTSGKTTSSYLLKHLLEAKMDAKVGLIGTNGNWIGDEFLHTEHTTPESYELHRLFRRMADAGCTHVVMEVSSHSLALERVAGITFDVAVYTNLSQDHLDFHKDMEDYAAAKRKLFSQSREAWLNADDPWTPFMMEGASCPCRTFSTQSNAADLVAKDVRLSASGVRFAAMSGGELALTKLSIPGLFNVYNALGVMAVGLSLGIPLSECADAMSSAKGVKGRMELVPTDGDYAVLIDYAHKPDALEKALKTLRPVTQGRLMVLFGCGGDRDHGKRPIMGRIAAELADLCVVTSDNPRTEEPLAIIDDILAGMKNSSTAVQVIPDREEAIAWVLDKARHGDVILLAGKGHEDYQVVGKEKRHMDEREIVAAVLAARERK
ncbi:MAG: UDP-N-acetylmuramoyl-L-alanyl-D-glutamate--2,6-diaminopimelate ligase [Oscillospiraceae bacterium]|nr:UDP-N-acetylmuramoyl-L-alanyl-D-glutamate--2,6-diaminopimelate ligase [Oscillospiraceae bacterium]